MQIYIAGIPHRKPNLSLLSIGDEVSLVPEPENKFDPNAIKVMHSSVHLGYIPKMETAHWSQIPVAFITEISPNRKWSEVVIATAKVPEAV